MDIELSLRELLVLRDPGVRFTDGVMSRVGDAPVGQQRDGVVQLVDARARLRSRRILIVTVIAVVAAAAVPTLLLRDRAEPPVVQDALPLSASSLPPAASSPRNQVPVQSGKPASSQNPLECLDPDVIRGIVLMGMNDQTFSTAASLPPELTDFKAPRQLSWVGSTERSYSSGSTVQSSFVYRTSLTPDAARSASVRVLTGSGWQLHSDGGLGSPGIFAAGEARSSGETYCRNGKPVTLTSSALDGVTYVVLATNRNPDRAGYANACDQAQPERSASVLDAYMPRLEMPHDPATGWPVPMNGGGRSGGDVKRSANTSFVIHDSIGNVAQHFAKQLAAQGWNAEAAWNGAETAGSTWTRRGDDDTALLGTLMLSAFEKGRFTAVFHVVRTK